MFQNWKHVSFLLSLWRTRGLFPFTVSSLASPRLASPLPAQPLPCTWCNVPTLFRGSLQNLTCITSLWVPGSSHHLARSPSPLGHFCRRCQGFSAWGVLLRVWTCLGTCLTPCPRHSYISNSSSWRVLCLFPSRHHKSLRPPARHRRDIGRPRCPCELRSRKLLRGP